MSDYKVRETTAKCIDDELKIQKMIPKELINEPFKKVLYYWISTRIPAYMRTESSIKEKDNEMIFYSELYNFLLQYQEGWIGYSYRKSKTSEELLFREGSRWIALERAAAE